MMPTFTTASEERIIGLIAAARTRLVLVAPAVSKTVASALAGRMANMPALSLTVILDADAEAYRMGYGDVEALDILRRAAATASFRLREQPGVRIGLVVADDQTLVYAPISANIEAGSKTEDKPNALFLGATVAKPVVCTSGRLWIGRSNV